MYSKYSVKDLVIVVLKYFLQSRWIRFCYLNIREKQLCTKDRIVCKYSVHVAIDCAVHNIILHKRAL